MLVSGFKIHVETRHGTSLLAKHFCFDQFADDMADHDVALLDARGVLGGHIQQRVGIVFHRTAGLAGQGDDFHSHLFGHLKSVEDVFGVAGSGDAHDDITGFGSAAQQAREDEVVAVVVAHRGKVGGVAVEGFGVERWPVEVETAGEFRGKVLRVCRAAAVATEMDFAAIAQRSGDHVCCLLDAAEEFGVVQNRLFRGDGLFDGLGDSGVHGIV